MAGAGSAASSATVCVRLGRCSIWFSGNVTVAGPEKLLHGTFRQSPGRVPRSGRSTGHLPDILGTRAAGARGEIDASIRGKANSILPVSGVDVFPGPIPAVGDPVLRGPGSCQESGGSCPDLGFSSPRDGCSVSHHFHLFGGWPVSGARC
jgi:hypothetical protein